MLIVLKLGEYVNHLFLQCDMAWEMRSMMFIWCFSGNAIVTARYICVLEGLARMKMQWGDMADTSDVSYVVSLERAECWVL